MKVPMRWLAEFVDTGLDPIALAQQLTMAGLEAEKIESIGNGWDKVFIGHVDRVERHPDADRLVLATVTAGEHHLTVVTGAPNIAEGQTVALALAGARLIDGHADGQVYKTLKPGMIRGIRSEGMVCSEKELGLSDEHEGIMVLEAEAPIGAPLADWLGDSVIEFEITPNLVHDFSILGIAREAAALTRHTVTLPEAYDLSTTPAGQTDLVTIADEELCSRYVAVVIEHVHVTNSPAWMQRRLLAAGLRPINSIVDVTNYVMLETGQPLHAFDADKLAEGRIVVRRAEAGETLETLDHQQRPLTESMLVIADAAQPIGIAGVMGGFESEVTDETTRIVLEAANFNMKSVRGTSRALKLRTDAAARFERGLDPNLARDAAARATKLMLDVSPGATVTAVSDVYPRPLVPRPLDLPYAEIERLLGVRYAAEHVLDVLDRLGFAPQLLNAGDTLRVTVPTWRSDVRLPADVVEEVARIIGYETLPERLPVGQTTPVQRDPNFLLQRKARRALTSAGAWETINYVTVGEDELHRLAPQDEVTPGIHPISYDDVIRLRNPLQAERDILRPTLLASLLATAAENLKHERGVRLFEIARTYLPANQDLPREANTLAILLAGKRDALDRFADANADLDFFDLKGMVELLLAHLGVEHARFTPACRAGMHPGRTASVQVGESEVGILGELRPNVVESFAIEAPRVAVAELDLDALLQVATPVPGGATVPRFLPVEQDFAIVVAESTPANEVEAALRFGAGPLAGGFTLFDIYRGPQIGEGNKSLAYRVTFTAPNRALTDAELGKVRDKIGKTLRQRVGGELRA